MVLELLTDCDHFAFWLSLYCWCLLLPESPAT